MARANGSLKSSLKTTSSDLSHGPLIGVSMAGRRGMWPGSRGKGGKAGVEVSAWLPITFTVGVGCVVTFTYAVAAYPALVPFLYVLQIVGMFMYRLIVFCKKNWHHFLLDICYWSNSLLVIYILLFPKSQRLFSVVFALNNGVVVGGGLFFKPSLVFHDSQQFISWYMHIIPAVVTWCIRTHPDNMFARFETCFPLSQGGCLVLGSFSTFFWHVLAPCIAYSVQTVLYMLWVWVLPHPRLRQKPGYTNSFLWLENQWEKKKRNLYYQAISCGGRIQRRLLISYTFTNTLLMWAFCFGSSTLFAYRLIHEIYIISVLVLMTFFGGTYYRHVIQHSNKPPNRQLDPRSHELVTSPKFPPNQVRHTWAANWNNMGQNDPRKDKEEIKKFLESLSAGKGGFHKPRVGQRRISPTTPEANNKPGKLTVEDEVQSLC